MSKKKIVLVNWLDTCSRDSRWVDPKERMVPVKCQSVGFLLEKTKKHVALAALDSEDNMVNNLNTIPRGCVQSIRYLKEPK